MRNPAAGRRGQALVEFALVVPMLLLIVVGTVEMGRLAEDHRRSGHGEESLPRPLQ